MDTFRVNQCVFAKMKGYPHWPGKILQKISYAKYAVWFYGTEQTGYVSSKHIMLPEEHEKMFSKGKTAPKRLYEPSVEMYKHMNRPLPLHFSLSSSHSSCDAKSESDEVSQLSLVKAEEPVPDNNDNRNRKRRSRSQKDTPLPDEMPKVSVKTRKSNSIHSRSSTTDFESQVEEILKKDSDDQGTDKDFDDRPQHEKAQDTTITTLMKTDDETPFNASIVQCDAGPEPEDICAMSSDSLEETCLKIDSPTTTNDSPQLLAMSSSNTSHLTKSVNDEPDVIINATDVDEGCGETNSAPNLSDLTESSNKADDTNMATSQILPDATNDDIAEEEAPVKAQPPTLTYDLAESVLVCLDKENMPSTADVKYAPAGLNLSEIRQRYQEHQLVTDHIVVDNSIELADAEKRALKEGETHQKQVRWTLSWGEPPLELGDDVRARWQAEMQQHRSLCTIAEVAQAELANTRRLANLAASEAACLATASPTLCTSARDQFLAQRQMRTRRIVEFCEVERDLRRITKDVSEALQLGKCDVAAAICGLQKMITLPITKLMISRQHQTMQLIQICRFYRASEKLQSAAAAVYKKLYDLFEHPSGEAFPVTYARCVDDYGCLEKTTLHEANAKLLCLFNVSSVEQMTEQQRFLMALEAQLAEAEFGEPPARRCWQLCPTRLSPSLDIEQWLDKSSDLHSFDIPGIVPDDPSFAVSLKAAR